MTPTVPDGPDTELAEQRLRAWLTSAPGLVSDVGGDLRPVLDELDRLRAVLAETRAKVASHEADLDLTINRLHNFGQVGDALAEALNDLLVQLPGYMGPTAARAEREAAVDADNAWRSVRGDAPAPAEPPADGGTYWADVRAERYVALRQGLLDVLDHRGPAEDALLLDKVRQAVSPDPEADRLRRALGSVWSELEAWHGSPKDAPSDEELAGVVRALVTIAPAAAPAEPPAVELPVTLDDADDVASVCVDHRLVPDGFGNWDAPGIRVEARDDQGWHIVLRGALGADLDYGYPTTVLLAAIEAARGGSR